MTCGLGTRLFGCAHTLRHFRFILDGNGTQPETIQLIGGELAAKLNPSPLSFYYEY